MKIGIAGIGRMGAAIALRLMAGTPVDGLEPHCATGDGTTSRRKSARKACGQIAATLGSTEILPVNFDVDSVRKDLRTMVEEAAARGFRLPLTECALECFDQASREGLGGRDCAMLPVIWSQRIGKQKSAGVRQSTPPPLIPGGGRND